jgi:acyl-CoA synthetase (AMP-forming)/AMP-acid ligase II
MQSPTEWVMEPGTMLRLVGEHRATLAWIPNFTLQFLARRVPERDRAGLDLSSMRALVNCSEPVRAQSMDEFLRAFEPRGFRAGALQSSYAMAETVFAVTQSTVGEPPRRLWIDGAAMRDRRRAEPCDSGREGAVCHVSSGTCIDGSRVRVLDAEGGDLAEGEAGELAVSSDSLFDGYFNRPDLSDKVLRGGWYLTGDLGFVLNGEVYVMGRKKDLIIVGGKNIYPQDIEEIACAHPRIQDGRAVALGLFNSDAGTEDIVLVAEARSEEDLAEAPLIERTLKNDVVATMGVAVRHVIIKPPRWIVKSTAGKPARSTTLEKLMREHPELR